MAYESFKTYPARGDNAFLIKDDKSPYQTIVLKIGNRFYDGLRQSLPPKTEEWCIANIK